VRDFKRNFHALKSLMGRILAESSHPSSCLDAIRSKGKGPVASHRIIETTHAS
jgi:hypothetical protein